MKTADPTKTLRALLKKLGKVDPPDLPETPDPLAVLVLSFLLWESASDKAATAYRRLMDGVVDYNDLRVCMPHETVELIGERYPRAVERCQRIRACLRDIFLREHVMSLERLETIGKRDVRKYVESLDGIVPYVASRVLLLCYDAHAVPVDEQLRTHLVKEGAAEEDLDVADLSAWLSRQVKANVALPTHHALQAWVDGQAGRSGRKSPTRKKATSGASGRTKKKTTTSRRKTT